MHFSKLLLERLGTLLSDRGLNQKALADGAQLSQSAITKYKSGSMPGSEELARIADFFSVSTDYLLGRDEKMETLLIKPRVSEADINSALEAMESLKKDVIVLAAAMQKLKHKTKASSSNVRISEAQAAGMRAGEQYDADQKK